MIDEFLELSALRRLMKLSATKRINRSVRTNRAQSRRDCC
jgi:hypothetical protein